MSDLEFDGNGWDWGREPGRRLGLSKETPGQGWDLGRREGGIRVKPTASQRGLSSLLPV